MKKITILQIGIVLLLFFLASTDLKAQLKVGMNPKTLSSNIYFEVESIHGSKFIVTKDSAKVGIGTSNPNTKLEINNGTIPGAIKIIDGTEGIGKVLTSDATGLGVWAIPTVNASNVTNSKSLTNSNGIIVVGGTGATLQNTTLRLDSTAIAKMINQSPIKDSLLKVVNANTSVATTFNITTRVLTTTVNGVTASVTIPNVNDSTTASNGLNLTGKDVRLGGTLNTATTINQGTNLMTFTGTPSSANSSVITLSNTATGANGTVLLDMLTPNSDVSYYRIGKSNTAGNSSEITYRNIGNNSDSNSLSFGFFGNQYLVNLTKNGNLGIGSNLFVPTQKLDVDGGARIRSLASGATTDSIVTVDGTGVLRRRSLSAVVTGDNWGSQTVAVSTPITGNGTSGSPLNITRANTTAANNLVTVNNGTNATFTAMTVGVDTTNLKSFLNNKITVSSSAPLSGNGTSGSPLSLTSNNTTAGQLVTVTNGTGASLTNMQVGVDTTALKTFVNGRTTVSNAFNTSTRALTTMVNGITSNAVTIPTTNDSTTASNGLTLTGKDVRLGGTLTGATTIATSNTNTLALSGLQNGTSGDSLVSLGAGGVLRKVAVSAVVTGDNWGSQTVAVSVPLTGNGTSGSPLNITRANTTAANNLVTVNNGTNATFTAMTVGVDTTNLKSFLNNKITVSSSAPLSGNGTSGSPLSLTSNNTTAGQLVTVTNGTGASLTNMQVGVDTTALKTFVNGRTTVSNAFNTSSRALTTTVNGITSNAVTIPTTNDSTTASNGLNLTGKDVRLGGTLNTATTINQGTNLMTFTGTPSSANSSVITLSNTAAGANGTVLLDMLTPNSDVSYYRLGKSTSFGNSAEITYRYTRDNSDSNSLSLGFFNSQYLVNLTKNGNLGIGANLFVPTQKLDVDGGARIRSLGVGASTDSIVTADANGVLRRRNAATILSGATTNTLTSATNTMTNTTNGVAASASIINTNALSVSGNSLTSTINGVASNAATVPNIYTADGTLTGNRTVTQGTNTITFTGSAVNSFSVDGSTFSVDGANNRIGVGTSTPTETLDVRGNAQIGKSDTTNFIAFRGLAGDGDGGYGHSYIGNRIYGGTDKSELLIYQGNDADNAAGPDRIRLMSGEHRFQTNSIDILNTTFSSVSRDPGFIDRMIIKNNGNVGIGTTSPTDLLDVNGTVRIRTLNAGASSDSIVTADANGVLRRRNVASIFSGATTNTLSSATNTMTNTTNGVAGSAPIINSNALSILGNTLTSTINGVVSNNATISNIYTADGSLTGERTVTNNGNALNFQGNGAGGFPIRLKSGTAASSEVTLGIYDRSASDGKGWMIGSNTFNGALNTNGNNSRELHFSTSGFANSGVKMKIDSAGNVGIGRNTDAGVRLAVQGGIAVGNGSFAVDPTYSQDNNFITFKHAGFSEDFIGYKYNTFYFADCLDGGDISNPNVIVLGNLGVGNTTPAAKLHVEGNARITSMSLGTANDSIVVVDANGELKKRASSAVATSNQLSASLSATVPALSIGDVGSVTVTIAGAAVGDAVIVNPTSDLPAGVVIAYSRVSAANTIKIGFSGTGSSSAYSQTFDIKVIK